MSQFKVIAAQLSQHASEQMWPLGMIYWNNPRKAYVVAYHPLSTGLLSQGAGEKIGKIIDDKMKDIEVGAPEMGPPVATPTIRLVKGLSKKERKRRARADKRLHGRR